MYASRGIFVVYRLASVNKFLKTLQGITFSL
jgi:hypothetical protein